MNGLYFFSVFLLDELRFSLGLHICDLLFIYAKYLKFNKDVYIYICYM